MAINVNTNVSAMTAQRYLNQAAEGQQKSMERLSSGYKINSAKDDAAGLQISNRLNAQSRGLDMAVQNANNGISIAQVAEGAMNESTNILQRMRDLSLQSSNGSNSKAERVAIQEEVTALNDELNRIAETTSFGGNKLLNGTFGTKSFQIGADSGEAVMLTMGNLRTDTSSMGGKSYSAEEGKDASWAISDKTQLTMSYTNKQGEEKELTINAKQGDDIEQLATYINGQSEDVKASVGEDGKLQVFAASQKVSGDVEFSGNLAGEIGFGDAKDITVNDIDVTSVAGSQEAVAIIDGALKSVDSQRSSLGSFQNRFNHAISNLENINENVNASNSRIKDTDYAKETTAMTKSQILQQASTSILAQAKQSPSAALSLLG
ncbi:flagellin [Vibrio sp. B1FLJ16]|uniref:flagellin n=1 Tax=Vibrio sp. B1FLJ16 TaxID=2751178 RepID=UPI0015F37817|nr:flagellin [Vibrio sp. B1FLJ16]MCA0934609.1 flagellin [Vibrio alginolyticus]CAD7809362.1 Flagellin is the subunit protein which polymerizes to form the filaments of bacterial flagella [Vibrio sp. B1FLJ16]CAD7810108.1 Flagellin is the subunit protein which polymerizes to form the filaments of bacterial flagella [Vibrio sp. B1FLJ16]CAE6909403.1 Flagellin is the subunit protein which polymerizes to form the filaments of bacterial flagella [Vibrio sp. B1FLJ16]CAE6912626.1 Flagellin is the subuni